MFTEPYLANVTVFAGNFAPRSWAFCDGSLISIAQNSALFALLGTTYGGDGITTFALPDLRSRIAVHPGNAAIQLGEVGGSELVNLTSQQMPQHIHTFVSITGGSPASTATGNTASPLNAVPAKPAKGLYNTSADGFGMAGVTALAQSPLAGASGPVPTLSPYLAMNYIIAVEGIFPSRN
jgi:microcystin-dependent protein